MDLLNEMANDGEPVGVTSNTPVEKLKELTDLCTRMQQHEKRLAQLEEAREETQKLLDEVSTRRIPDLFDELNLSSIKLKDGSTVSVSRDFAASITEENSGFCLNWLRENNHEGIIKHDVTAKLKKGEKEECKKLVAFLKKEGLTFSDKEYVHPKTLQAFVREQMENGTDLPQEKFKVFPIRKTKIK